MHIECGKQHTSGRICRKPKDHGPWHVDAEGIMWWDTMVPTIHLNGTNKQALLDEYEAAIVKLNEAQEALGKVTVHGRDFYVQEGNAISVAIEQQVARIKKLREVEYELRHIWEGIHEQKGKGE